MSSTRTQTQTVLVVDLQRKHGVRWDKGTKEINENSGKKKSKRCCIYHRPHTFGESDTESGSDVNDSGSEYSDDNSGGGFRSHVSKPKPRKANHHHHCCSSSDHH
eukprot:GCRY01001387.1.p1 GENE.GCRY01001387.1~~GCRY01001387.1.p1  ORF type:complete len:105 (-),score=8.34 GCRY01001387.1:54-368(-)